MNLPATYQQVPVSAAQRIASDHAKDMVIIVCWDQAYQVTHVTTYGKSATFKSAAATAGERIAKYLDLDQSKLDSFEDFRVRGAAEAAKTIERLQAERDALAAACRLWDEGFNDGDEFTEGQFLKWVNDNRRAARVALGTEPRDNT